MRVKSLLEIIRTFQPLILFCLTLQRNVFTEMFKLNFKMLIVFEVNRLRFEADMTCK